MTKSTLVSGPVDSVATLYAPAIAVDGSNVTVIFSADHPGAYDDDYRARRAKIATTALEHVRGNRPPWVEYTAAEQGLWREVARELVARHHRYAAKEYLDGAQALDLDHRGVPQLFDVSKRLDALTGFQLDPAPGLVPVAEFYGVLASRRFLATNFLRHPSMPNFSPEPDMLHEIFGHANALANPRFAELYVLTGHAVKRLTTAPAVQLLSRLFWFFLEYGVVLEKGEPKAYGASMLSSPGELDQFESVELAPLDPVRMAHRLYDVTGFQPLLFAARSFDEVEDVFGGFLLEIDDETPARFDRAFAKIDLSVRS